MEFSAHLVYNNVHMFVKITEPRQNDDEERKPLLPKNIVTEKKIQNEKTVILLFVVLAFLVICGIATLILSSRLLQKFCFKSYMTVVAQYFELTSHCLAILAVVAFFSVYFCKGVLQISSRGRDFDSALIIGGMIFLCLFPLVLFGWKISFIASCLSQLDNENSTASSSSDLVAEEVVSAFAGVCVIAITVFIIANKMFILTWKWPYCQPGVLLLVSLSVLVLCTSSFASEVSKHSTIQYYKDCHSTKFDKYCRLKENRLARASSFLIPLVIEFCIMSLSTLAELWQETAHRDPKNRGESDNVEDPRSSATPTLDSYGSDGQEDDKSKGSTRTLVPQHGQNSRDNTGSRTTEVVELSETVSQCFKPPSDKRQRRDSYGTVSEISQQPGGQHSNSTIDDRSPSTTAAVDSQSPKPPSDIHKERRLSGTPAESSQQPHGQHPNFANDIIEDRSPSTTAAVDSQNPKPPSDIHEDSLPGTPAESSQPPHGQQHPNSVNDIIEDRASVRLFLWLGIFSVLATFTIILLFIELNDISEAASFIPEQSTENWVYELPSHHLFSAKLSDNLSKKEECKCVNVSIKSPSGDSDNEDESNMHRKIKTYFITTTSINVACATLFVVLLLELSKLNIKANHSFSVSDFIIITSCSAVIGYQTLCIAADIYCLCDHSACSSLGTGYYFLQLFDNLTDAIQFFLQGYIVLRVERCKFNGYISGNGGRSWRILPGLLIFLFAVNALRWGADSFYEMKSENDAGFFQAQSTIYGKRDWHLITQTFYPLALYFRFHSAVLFLKAFYHTWLD